jgi:hypothetical protein
MGQRAYLAQANPVAQGRMAGAIDKSEILKDCFANTSYPKK